MRMRLTLYIYIRKMVCWKNDILVVDSMKSDTTRVVQVKRMVLMMRIAY
jgi:hypothetical protein